MTGRNYGLDVLRAAAILLVLTSHATFFIILNLISILTILKGLKVESEE
jgi:peptidoglycan/LPS O-acetylase OafA/YrhL